MKNLFLVLVLSVFPIILCLFAAYVSFDIIDLYNIPHLKELSIAQIYATTLVGYTLFPKRRKEREDKDSIFTEEDFLSIVERTLSILIAWAFAYITHIILF
jgi:hypothetical protein